MGAMVVEIERKFLVKPGAWTPKGEGVAFRQGYLSVEPGRVVRVRLEGNEGRLTVKGRAKGIARAEYEYAIPAGDAAHLLQDLCLKPLVVKRRHTEEHGGKTWEIDVFEEENEGLVVAEIELASEGERFDLPAWAGDEVTHDPKYSNASLVSRPFRDW